MPQYLTATINRTEHYQFRQILPAASDMKESILILHEGIFGTPGKGGCPRLFNFFKLNQEKFDLHLINVVDAGDQEARESLEMLRQEVALRRVVQLRKSSQASATGKIMHTLTGRPYFYEGLRRRSNFLAIRDHVSRFCSAQTITTIYASSLSVSQYCMGNGVPLVADIHDAISLLAWRSSRAGGTLAKRMREMAEAVSIRRYEKKLCRASTFYVVNSAVDYSYLTRFMAPHKLAVIENGVDVRHFFHRPAEEGGDTLVFSGDLGYAPNEQAAVFLATRIFPRLQARYGELRLKLVGRSPSPAVLALREKAGVQVTGFVPDIRPHIWEAGIYISPLRFGTGMKNKILEAMSLGAPIVASEISCDGIEVEDGKHLLIARTEKDFLDAVSRLREEKGLAARLSFQARRLVEQRYCWEAKAAQLGELLETASSRQAMRTGGKKQEAMRTR
jgi:glycosyltransferase involved in cell wall biosynthesis